MTLGKEAQDSRDSGDSQGTREVFAGPKPSCHFELQNVSPGCLHCPTLCTGWSVISALLTLLVSGTGFRVTGHLRIQQAPNPAMTVTSPQAPMKGPMWLLPWQSLYIPSVHLPTFTCASDARGCVTAQIEGRPLLTFTFFPPSLPPPPTPYFVLPSQ